jgi:hypothetical protein
MNSPNDATTNRVQPARAVERIGLTAVAAQLDDMLAHAGQAALVAASVARTT